MADIHLDPFTLDNYPYIIPVITELKHIKANSSYIEQNNTTLEYHIFYIWDGEFTFKTKRNTSQAFVSHTVKKGSFLSAFPTQAYSLEMTSKKGEFIHLGLLFYTKKGIAVKEPSHLSPLPIFSPDKILKNCENTSLNLFIPETSQIPELSPMYMLLKDITLEIDTLNDGYFNVLQSQINLLFLQMFRQSAKNYETIYSNVNRIYFASTPYRYYPPLPKDCTIEIKNICVKLKENINKNVKVIVNFNLKSFYKNPQPFAADVQCECVQLPIENHREKNEDVLVLKTDKVSYYGVEIRTEKNEGVNIYPYIQRAYVEMDVRSTHRCNIYFSLINSNNYTQLYRDFSISEPDKWETVRIPLIGHKLENEYSTYIENCLKYISKNYLHKLTIQEIADHINISVSHLSRIFKQETSISLNKYITQIRIEKVRELLANTDLSIEEISNKTGFYDATYLCKSFKKHTGLSPNAFRNNIKKEQNSATEIGEKH